MSGAYRCPVCGIDFPSGTPGTPDLKNVAPEPEMEPEPAPRAATLREDVVDAEFEHDDALDIAPGAGRAGSGPRVATADLNVRPREDPRADGGAATATLFVRPARESVVVSVPEIDYTTEMVDPPRRGWMRGLGGTLVSAIVLIAIVAGTIWWLNARDALPSRALSDFNVELADGWVSLPTEGRALVVSADGPFRLRVAGRVYSLDGNRAIQVPADASAAVRIVREPTTATISER